MRSFRVRQGLMRYLWLGFVLSLTLSACGGQAEPRSTESQPPGSGRQVTTTVSLPGVDTEYDSVDHIRSKVEEGGFVCAAWEARPGDDFALESASCVGVLEFAVYDNPALIVEHLGHQNSLLVIDSDVVYDLVGPNWSVTCQDRQDICGDLKGTSGWPDRCFRSDSRIAVRNPSIAMCVDLSRRCGASCALFDELVVLVSREAAGIAVHDFDHHLRRPFHSEDFLGEVLCAEFVPDQLVVVGREDLGWVADCHPPDWHHALIGDHCLDVDDSVYAYLGLLAHGCPVEDRYSGGNERLGFDVTAAEMGVGTDQYMVANSQRMVGGAAEDGVFHDDTTRSDCDWTAFGGHHRSVEDPRVRADLHVARHGGGGSHPCRFVDTGGVTGVFDQHRAEPILFDANEEARRREGRRDGRRGCSLPKPDHIVTTTKPRNRPAATCPAST